jgi:hypothetical protein
MTDWIFSSVKAEVSIGAGALIPREGVNAILPLVSTLIVRYGACPSMRPIIDKAGKGVIVGLRLARCVGSGFAVRCTPLWLSCSWAATTAFTIAGSIRTLHSWVAA